MSRFEICKPFLGWRVLTQGWGENENYYWEEFKVRGGHNGEDYGLKFGEVILAAKEGLIAAVGFDGPWGMRVKIKHDGGYVTLYAHMEAPLKGLFVGQKVKQGAPIGYAGWTGNVIPADMRGTHLHFGVYKDGVAVNPANYYADRQQVIILDPAPIQPTGPEPASEPPKQKRKPAPTAPDPSALEQAEVEARRRARVRRRNRERRGD